MLRAQLKARLAEAWPELDDRRRGGATASEALALAAERCARTSRSSTSGCRCDRASTSRARSAARCHVVFVTAYDEYAVAAFDEGAVDYVLKPPTPERIAKVVARLKARLAAPPLDLTALLAQLARARRRARPAQVDPRVARRSMRMIAVDDVLYFQAEDKYTQGRHRRRRSADPEADQGALRRARPRGVLADPSRHDRQPARDRPRRARLARPAGDRAQATATKSSPSAARSRIASRRCSAARRGRRAASVPADRRVATPRASLRSRPLHPDCAVEFAALPGAGAQPSTWTTCSRPSTPRGNRAPTLSPATAPADAARGGRPRHRRARRRAACASPRSVDGAWVDAPVDQEGGAAVVPARRQRADRPRRARRAPFRFYDKVPTKFAQYDDAGVRQRRRARRAARGRAARRVHRAATSC